MSIIHTTHIHIPIHKHRKLKRDSDSFGRFNDEVHQSIYFCPVVKAFIDTRPFQRLRKLLQLGTSQYLYMNCNHTRFEHSLGVAHLAEMMVKKLKEKQPQLPITGKDILCIKLAGLFHDLGHGPFSHIYDTVFPSELNKHLIANKHLRKKYKGLPNVPENWEHEDGSCMMIDAALVSLGLAIDFAKLDEPLKQIGNGVEPTSMRFYPHVNFDYDAEEDDKMFDASVVLTSRDFVFIKECITGKPIHAPPYFTRSNITGFLGRPDRHQEFLYDIVANRWSGLDVDKIDYFARDQRRALGTSGDVQLRVIEEAIVCWATCPKPDKCYRCQVSPPEKRRHMMICYPVKLGEQIMQFFKVRFKLHNDVYKAKKTQAVTFMIADILALADPYFRITTRLEFENTPGNKSDVPDGLPPSRAMLDPCSYMQLDDSIIDKIPVLPDPELKPARQLIQRLLAHDFYKCAGKRAIILSRKIDLIIWAKEENEIRDEILALPGIHTDDNGEIIKLTSWDVIVEKCDMHHGAKHRNPMELVRFLSKADMHLLCLPMDNLPEAKQMPIEDFDGHVPRVAQRQAIRVFCRGSPAKTKLLAHIFFLWESHNEDQYSGALPTKETPLPVAVAVPDDRATTMRRSFLSPSDQGVYGIQNGKPTSVPPKALRLGGLFGGEDDVFE